MIDRTTVPLRILLVLLAVAALWIAPQGAQAQTIPVNLSWTNPTVLTDGTPATGINAQTGVEVHWATASIPVTGVDAASCALPCSSGRAPQATLGLVATSTHTIAATNGSTLYFRLKALTASFKSAFSNEATKLVAVPTPIGPPTNLRIDVVVSQREDGAYTMALVVREAWEETIYNGG
jgi:hypothetical protein